MTRAQWQIDQGNACGCRGVDDMCPCQNTNRTTHPASTDSPAEGGAVAWRWRFDDAGLSNWYYGPVAPGNKAGQRSMLEPSDVQPLYTRPAPIEPGVREKVARIIVDRTGVGTLGLTDAASMRAALPLADEILALLSSNTGEG